MVPLLWAFYTSLRPNEDINNYAFFSVGGPYNFDNYSAAWTQAQLPKFFLNTVIIAVPAVVLTLFLSSMVAFSCPGVAGGSTSCC